MIKINLFSIERKLKKIYTINYYNVEFMINYTNSKFLNDRYFMIL